MYKRTYEYGGKVEKMGYGGAAKKKKKKMADGGRS